MNRQMHRLSCSDSWSIKPALFFLEDERWAGLMDKHQLEPLKAAELTNQSKTLKILVQQLPSLPKLPGKRAVFLQSEHQPVLRGLGRWRDLSDLCVRVHKGSCNTDLLPHWKQIVVGMNEFGCYEAKIGKVKKASSLREMNPAHFWLEPPVLCHWATSKFIYFQLEARCS